VLAEKTGPVVAVVDEHDQPHHGGQTGQPPTGQRHHVVRRLRDAHGLGPALRDAPTEHVPEEHPVLIAVTSSPSTARVVLTTVLGLAFLNSHGWPRGRLRHRTHSRRWMDRAVIVAEYPQISGCPVKIEEPPRSSDPCRGVGAHPGRSRAAGGKTSRGPGSEAGAGGAPVTATPRPRVLGAARQAVPEGVPGTTTYRDPSHQPYYGIFGSLSSPRGSP